MCLISLKHAAIQPSCLPIFLVQLARCALGLPSLLNAALYRPDCKVTGLHLSKHFELSRKGQCDATCLISPLCTSTFNCKYTQRMLNGHSRIEQFWGWLGVHPRTSPSRKKVGGSYHSQCFQFGLQLRHLGKSGLSWGAWTRCLGWHGRGA